MMLLLCQMELEKHRLSSGLLERGGDTGSGTCRERVSFEKGYSGKILLESQEHKLIPVALPLSPPDHERRYKEFMIKRTSKMVEQ